MTNLSSTSLGHTCTGGTSTTIDTTISNSVACTTDTSIDGMMNSIATSTIHPTLSTTSSFGFVSNKATAVATARTKTKMASTIIQK